MKRPEVPVLGEFEQLVLLALVRLGPEAYGATIRREIEARTGRDLAISAVYVTLDRLEVKGLARSRVGEPRPNEAVDVENTSFLQPAGTPCHHGGVPRLHADV
jgi:hypothetical protein